MANHTRRSRQHFADRRVERLAWLRARPELWDGLPSTTEDVDEEQSLRLGRLVDLMRSANLFSDRTVRADVKHSIRLLIGTLQGTRATPTFSPWKNGTI